MQTYHFTHHTMPDQLKRIAKCAYPDYKGKKFSLIFGKPSDLSSYWDGGSRNYYVLYDLDTQRVQAMPSSHPAFEPARAQLASAVGQRIQDLPQVIVVERSYSCGRDCGIRFHADASRVQHMLPSGEDASDDERTVLEYTARLKNTYGGRTNIRFSEAQYDKGITQERWLAAQQSCIGKRWLRKNGSITPEGRNQI